MKKDAKKIILCVDNVTTDMVASIQALGEKKGEQYQIAVIRDRKKKDWTEKAKELKIKLLLTPKFSKPGSIAESLHPYRDRIVALVCRGENRISDYRKVIPHLPFLPAPTDASLAWATDKLLMREMFTAHDPSMGPKYTIVKDATDASIAKIKKKVGFPLVIKPAGLAASLLVTLCFHEEELQKTLKTVIKKINKIYKERGHEEKPKILVEEFMEGEMYSIDAYIDARGEISWCPFVHIKTGRTIGFDDFFNYRRITPSTMKQETQERARAVATKGIRALGMRSTTAHVELMRTDDGWKVIEIGSRIGGFRQLLYSLSYGIDHGLNDVKIKMDLKPTISKQQKGFAGALKFYAKKEGYLDEFKGLKKVQKLASFDSINVYLKKGDKCLFAKHGGKGVCDVVLFNKKRADLLADMRRAEEIIKISTTKKMAS